MYIVVAVWANWTASLHSEPGLSWLMKHFVWVVNCPRVHKSACSEIMCNNEYWMNQLAVSRQMAWVPYWSGWNVVNNCPGAPIAQIEFDWMNSWLAECCFRSLSGLAAIPSVVRSVMHKNCGPKCGRVQPPGGDICLPTPILAYLKFPVSNPTHCMLNRKISPQCATLNRWFEFNGLIAKVGVWVGSDQQITAWTWGWNIDWVKLRR